MRIVQLAALEEPLPTKKYGGIELVVHNITEELVKRGHEVYLFSVGTSQTSANLVPLLPQSIREMFPPDKFTPEEVNKWRDFYKIYSLGQILKKIKDLKPDIVHNHLNWRLVLFSELIECPLISTMHGPLTSLTERETYSYFKNSNYISISNNQRKAMADLNWIATVYNGIEVDKFDLETKKGDYFAFLGRTSPEKGLMEICQMIKKTKHKLVIAAKVDAVDVGYFENRVKPYIDNKQIKFIGEVDHKGKNILLKNAKALLMWPNWEEPFGLVVVEAMVCGTPVIANYRGAMPELIINEKTGYLVSTLKEMAKRLDSVGSIDSKMCRQHVIKHFSKEKMVDDYEVIFKKIVSESDIKQMRNNVKSEKLSNGNKRLSSVITGQ